MRPCLTQGILSRNPQTLFLSIYLSFFLYLYLYLYISISLYLYLSTSLYLYLYLFVSLSIHPSIYPSGISGLFEKSELLQALRKA